MCAAGAVLLLCACQPAPTRPASPALSPAPSASVTVPAPPTIPGDPGEGDTTAPPPPGTMSAALPPWDRAAACGVERWAVKTGMDPAASQVNMVPVPATVAALGAAPAPAALGPARLPQEMRTVTVTAMLVSVKRESDSDLHLVLSVAGATMIGEIPHPSCVASGPFRAGSARARAALDALVPQLARSGGFVPVGRQVTLTGVLFFDPPHKQTGKSPNGAELHPIVSLVAR